jgi:hypothetical protein
VSSLSDISSSARDHIVRVYSAVGALGVLQGVSRAAAGIVLQMPMRRDLRKMDGSSCLA